MLRAFTTLVLATAVSFAALAQTGSGGGGTTSSDVGANQPPPPAVRTPEMQSGRAAPAPGTAGGRRTLSRGPMLPGGDSPARETRRGGGAADLNNNSATIGPTGVGPTGVGPTGVGPTGLGTSGSGAATSRSQPLGPGTGARDTGVPDSSVYNPGVGSRQR